MGYFRHSQRMGFIGIKFAEEELREWVTDLAAMLFYKFKSAAEMSLSDRK
jgi:hypothetical protein